MPDSHCGLVDWCPGWLLTRCTFAAAAGIHRYVVVVQFAVASVQVQDAAVRHVDDLVQLTSESVSQLHFSMSHVLDPIQTY